MVNGERSDSLLTDAVVSGSKRRSQSGSAEPKKDGEMADRTVALEQVWGQGLPSHTLCCHFLNSVLLIAQLHPNFVVTCVRNLQDWWPSRVLYPGSSSQVSPARDPSPLFWESPPAQQVCALCECASGAQAGGVGPWVDMS